MSLVFNMVGGAGGSAELPAIYASYPEGSVCTCSNGTKTYTAKDTSGYWLFAGLDIGTWTVTATDPTDPTKTDSDTVEILTEGQSVSVTLSYALWLFKEGDQFDDVTGGWNANGYSTGVSNLTVYQATINNGAIELFGAGPGYVMSGTQKAIDLTKFDTLKIRRKVISTYSGVFGLSFQLTTNKILNQAVLTYNATDNIGTEIVDSIDISALTGPYYFSVRAEANAACDGYVYETWLE